MKKTKQNFIDWVINVLENGCEIKMDSKEIDDDIYAQNLFDQIMLSNYTLKDLKELVE